MPDGALGAAGAPHLSEHATNRFREQEFERLASFAAAARTGAGPDGAGAAAGGAFQLPGWWDPAPVLYVGESGKAARQAEANRALARLTKVKVEGKDHDLDDLLALRRACQVRLLRACGSHVG